jgi:hypothetical protein
VPKSQFVVILVVKDVEKISVKGVNIFDFREIFQNVEQLLIQSLLTEFNFPHVERPDSADCIARVDDCGGFSLCLGQNDID